MGATQNSSTSGACNAMRTRCQPSSMRRMGPGSAPLKRRLWRPAGVSKKRSGSVGARRLMTDSMPTASGFSRVSLNFRVISQAASKPLGAGLQENALRERRFPNALLLFPSNRSELVPDKNAPPLVSAVGVVVHAFSTRGAPAGTLPVSASPGANGIALGIGVEVRGINSGNIAGTAAIVALGAQEHAARLQHLIGGL